MSFSQNDLNNFKAFKSVMKQADFELKGEALIAVGQLYSWFYSLEGKIAELVKKEESASKFKPSKGKKTAEIKPIQKGG